MNDLAVDLARHYAEQDRNEIYEAALEPLIEEQVRSLTAEPVSFAEVVDAVLDRHPDLFLKLWQAYYLIPDSNRLSPSRSTASHNLVIALNQSLHTIASNSAAQELAALMEV